MAKNMKRLLYVTMLMLAVAAFASCEKEQEEERVIPDPCVTTLDVKDIGLTSATFTGVATTLPQQIARNFEIGFELSLEKGFPKKAVTRYNAGKYDSKKSFSYVADTCLLPNTTYYVRAYMTNNSVTYLGEAKSFSTQAPSAFASAVAGKVTSRKTSVTFTAGIGDMKPGDVVMGVCWSAGNAEPTINDKVVPVLSLDSKKQSDVEFTGLRNGSYHYRPFVKIDDDVYYGDVQSFEVERVFDANGREYVDLGLPSAIFWATVNVGSANPEEYGQYFAWGELEEKENYKQETYFDADFSIYNLTGGKTVLESAHDAVLPLWGGSWRMPAADELKELIDECTWTWTTKNGKYGYKVQGKAQGYTDKSIFLPAGGYHSYSYTSRVNSTGNYWSNTLSADDVESAIYLNVSSDTRVTTTRSRYDGLNIRPVIE